MTNGIKFAVAFLVFIAALELIGKFLGGNSIDGLGKMLLSVSLSMLIMIGVVKLAGQLDPGEMIKGGIFAAAFLVFLSALIKITSKGGETVKLAGTLLAVSVAIGILAGISVLLGLVDTEQLVKGVLAVALLGIIMTRMIRATQGANDVKGNVIAMAVAIGVMAAAVAALSLIDSTKLVVATACLGTLMGIFALMELAGSKASGSIVSLIAITAVVVVLAGVLYLLRDLPVKNSLAVAASLSILLLSIDVKGTSDAHNPFLKIWLPKESMNVWWEGTSSNMAKFVPTKEFKRASVTFTIPSSYELPYILFGIHGNIQSDLYIRNAKLEKGTVATDWTPAPEDLKTRISDAETAISNNAKEIKLKASQDEVTAISDNLKVLTKTSTEFKQTVEGWQLNWDKLISTDNAEVASHQDYITFDKGDIILGESSNDLKLKITNDSIQFKGTSDTEVTPDKDATAWITGKTFHISDGEIQNSLKFGDILMKPTSSGNLAIDDYAEFGPTVRIGNPSSRYTRINSNGLMVNNENTVIAQIGYGTAGDPNGGNSVYAFYTFGERKTGTLSGGYSLVEGFNNTATGFCAHAEGWSSIASGTSAHAEGSSTASGDDSHAEGSSTTASGDDSHTEGMCTTASGQSSHAEGEHTEASEIGAHAEGSYTKAMGAYSHAEGGSTTASGDYSHAGGVGTIAKNDYQTVIGRYNANKNSAFIIGNGSSDTERSNALTVDWDGNITGKSLTSANDLKLGFGSSNIFKPYFTKGDSITLTIYAVGYVTTGGKEVAMYVPLSRPIIAGGSVSVASVNGLTIRQNGKYLYSSSASNSVNPSSFRAAIVGSGCGVNIVATFGNTVNATVNDVCSITASIKITFS